MQGLRSISAALILAAALIAIPGAHARSLLQASSTPAVCTIDSSTTQLDFKEVTSACVAASTTSPTRGFCDSCTCALFSAFAPALKAAGVTNASDAQAVSKGVEVVAACVNSFLAQFVAAKVDINALVALSSCEYKDNEVPSCLMSRVAALTGSGPVQSNTTTDFRSNPNPTTSQSPVPSSISPSVDTPVGEYAPDPDAPGQIIGAINNTPVPVMTPTTTTTTTSPEPAITPVTATGPDSTPPSNTVTPLPQVVVTPVPANTAMPIASPAAAPVPVSAPAAGHMVTTSIMQVATALVAATLLLVSLA